MDSFTFTPEQLKCFYCLPFVRRHDWENGTCKTCSMRWFQIRDKAVPLGDPVFPLKSDCIRGMKIQHGVNCEACAYWRSQYPCTKHLTKDLYKNNVLDQEVMDKVKGFCLDCNQNHHVDPSMMDTLCSEGCVITRPRYYCLEGSRHSFCKWHGLSKSRQICCRCLKADIERQGQVSSHPTGNHQSAVHAGGNVTLINYYGQNYNAANNPMAQSIDPQAVASGVTSTLGAASNFIASPTMEELAGDQSDRLMQIILGNSSMITQEAAAGAVVAWGVEPAYLEPQSNTVDLPTRPGPSCDRFYTLNSYEWTPGSSGWQIPFPGALSSLGVFGTNLAFHYLYRAGALIHVQVNATQFHTGSLYVGVVPECEVKPLEGSNLYDRTSFFSDSEIIGSGDLQLDDTLGAERICQLMVFPHQIINLRTCNSATIVVPFMNITPASCFTTHNIFRVLIIPLTTLRPPPQYNQTIPITVSIAPMVSQFNGLRNGVEAQGVPTFQVPGSGEFVSTLSNDGMPAYMVWSDMPRFPIPGRVDNMISVARIQTLLRVADGGGTFGIAVQNQSGLNQRIYAFDLSVLATAFSTTYVGRLSRFFSYYRGTINLNFMFIGPRQSSGKILIAYTPPGGNQPQSREEAMLSTHVIWDIGLQSTLVFPLPYISTSPYRFANRSGDTASFDGWVTLWYQTNIVTAPNCAPECDLLVFAAAGSDFSLHCLTDSAFYQGPGDGLAGALQNAINATVNNAVAGSVATLPLGPTQPESGGAQPGITQGHAPALEALETGTSTVSDPSQMIAVEPGAIMQLSAEETSIANFLSRYYWLVEMDLAESWAQKFDLNLNSMMNTQPMLKAVLNSFTYFRSDLDVVIVATANTTADLALQATFAPPGSATQINSSNWFKGVNPTVVFRLNQPPAAIRIPYSGVAPYMAVHYDGFSSFGAGGDNDVSKYKACPANIFGTLLIRRMSPSTTTETITGLRVHVFVRFVNPECYIPRPIVSFKESTPRTTTRSRLEVGDVENFIPPSTDNWDELAARQGPDPLPLELPEGPDFDGVWIEGEYYAPVFVEDDDGNIVHRKWTPYLREIAVAAPDLSVFTYEEVYLQIDALCEIEDVVDAHDQMSALYDTLNWMCGVNWPLRRRLQVVAELLALRIGFETPDDGYFSDLERQGPFQSIGEGLAKGLQESFQAAITRIEETRRDACDSWWKTVIGLVAKFVSVLVIVVRSRADPATLAAVGTLVSVDLLNACPFGWIKRELCDLLGIRCTQREGISTFLKDLNVAITAAKGLEWIVNKLMELANWIKEFLLPKTEERKENAIFLEEAPTHLRDWRIYQADPSKFTEASAVECANKVLKVREILEKEKPDSPIIRYNGPLFASAARFVMNSKHRTVEPMGVLIHGEPGTGKSLATKLIGNAMSKHYGSDVPYSLPPDPTYFDNYNGQPVVIMDDLGQNPDGKDMTLLCQMISAVDFITPQADLPDKGKPFVSRLICASTNQRNLAPPTVAHPSALKRRFNFDLNINVFPSYAINGKLDVDKAFDPCPHQSQNFPGCCPFICGQAVSFVDRTTSEHLTLDQLVTNIKQLDAKRSSLSVKVDAFLQGPVCRSTLKRVVGHIEKQGRRKLPQELKELIENDPAPGRPMLQYAYDLGYEIPDDIVMDAVVTETYTISNKWKNIAIAVGAAAAVITTGVLIWKAIPVNQEGPYSGIVQRRLERPVRRVAEVQGPDPDTQFATSLLRHNIFPITTGTGQYTALGVYDTWVVLPLHAAVGPYFINGQEHKPEKEVELVWKGMNLELVVVNFPTLQQFKDVRKFMSLTFAPVSDAVLVLNTDDLPRTIINVRRVYTYGVLNLEGDATANVLYYQTPTKKGYCGAPIVKAGKIIGIHIGGDGVNGYCAQLKPSYFANLEGVMSETRPARRPTNVNRRSRFEKSVYYDVVEQLFGITKQPAVLSQNDPRLQVNLDEALFSKYTGNKEVECPELDEAIEQYASQLKTILPMDVAEPLKLEEAVHGYGRLEALDLATSAGFPYCTMGVTKRSLIEDDCKGLIEGLDLYGYNQPYVTFLKDELRGNSKIPVGKTRVVEASSINDTARMRMTFGRFFDAMHANPGTVSGMAVGCNPDLHFTRFATELGNGNVFSYDYSGYDASLSPGFFDALIELFVKLGFDRESITPVINHITYSTHIYANKEYDVVGGMPSGTSGTSVFNSLINNLIIKTLVLKAYHKIDLWQLKILAYGDDVLIDYPYPLDAEVLANLGKTLGLTITPADKSDKFKPPGPIEEHTFLKRGFKPDSRYPFLYHPTFPKDEIYQSLAWTRDPRTMPEHVLSLAHLIWHNGPEDYEEFVKIVHSTPVGRVVPLPTYRELLRGWYDMF